MAVDWWIAFFSNSTQLKKEEEIVFLLFSSSSPNQTHSLNAAMWASIQLNFICFFFVVFDGGYERKAPLCRRENFIPLVQSTNSIQSLFAFICFIEEKRRSEVSLIY